MELELLIIVPPRRVNRELVSDNDTGGMEKTLMEHNEALWRRAAEIYYDANPGTLVRFDMASSADRVAAFEAAEKEAAEVKAGVEQDEAEWAAAEVAMGLKVKDWPIAHLAPDVSDEVIHAVSDQLDAAVDELIDTGQTTVKLPEGTADVTVKYEEVDAQVAAALDVPVETLNPRVVTRLTPADPVIEPADFGHPEILPGPSGLEDITWFCGMTMPHEPHKGGDESAPFTCNGIPTSPLPTDLYDAVSQMRDGIPAPFEDLPDGSDAIDVGKMVSDRLTREMGEGTIHKPVTWREAIKEFKDQPLRVLPPDPEPSPTLTGRLTRPDEPIYSSRVPGFGGVPGYTEIKGIKLGMSDDDRTKAIEDWAYTFGREQRRLLMGQAAFVKGFLAGWNSEYGEQAAAEPPVSQPQPFSLVIEDTVATCTCKKWGTPLVGLSDIEIGQRYQNHWSASHGANQMTECDTNSKSPLRHLGPIERTIWGPRCTTCMISLVRTAESEPETVTERRRDGTEREIPVGHCSTRSRHEPHIFKAMQGTKMGEWFCDGEPGGHGRERG